jgi:hypothetical protein
MWKQQKGKKDSPPRGRSGLAMKHQNMTDMLTADFLAELRATWDHAEGWRTPQTPQAHRSRRRRNQAFNQNDVARALRAARAAGVPDARVVVDVVSGTITIIPGPPKHEEPDVTNVNPWLVGLEDGVKQ